MQSLAQRCVVRAPAAATTRHLPQNTLLGAVVPLPLHHGAPLSTKRVESGYDGWAIEKHGGGGGGDGVAEQEQEVRVVRMASNPVNCINPRFLDQLDATLGQLERENARSHPSPVVFASASEKTYCAGLDLKTVLAMPRDELTHFIDRLNASYVRLLTLDCPTVAAVNGHAIAGGALLALSADYRVATGPGKSLFGVSEVQLGMPFPSGPWAVMHHVALTRPLLYALARSGDLVSIDDAHHQFGLIDHLLPQQGTTDLTKGSVDYARAKVASHSLRAFVAVKQALQRPIIERYEMERRTGDLDRTFVDLFFSDDARDAIKKSLEGLKQA